MKTYLLSSYIESLISQKNNIISFHVKQWNPFYHLSQQKVIIFEFESNIEFDAMCLVYVVIDTSLSECKLSYPLTPDSHLKFPHNLNGHTLIPQDTDIKGTHTVYFSSFLYIINQKPRIPRTDFLCITTWVARSSG